MTYGPDTRERVDQEAEVTVDRLIKEGHNSVAGYAMESNPLSRDGPRVSRPRPTWHRTVYQECKMVAVIAEQANLQVRTGCGKISIPRRI